MSLFDTGNTSTLGDRLRWLVFLAAPLASAALIGWGDLGAIGETWTGNSVSFADGRLYHRTARELLCIGAAPRAVAGAAPGAATGAER